MPARRVSNSLLAVCAGGLGMVARANAAETCSEASPCAAGRVCVADVGEEYALGPGRDVCERPVAVYGFLHFGELGEDGRVDDALDMIEGVYRLPRMPGSQGGVATVPHSLVLRDGTRVSCAGLEPGSGRRDCEVPDWAAYYGGELGRYDQFILFGLRMAGPLFYVQQHATDARLAAGLTRRQGRAPAGAELPAVRLEARHLALALLDSFVRRGHLRFALGDLPACVAASGAGYQNPNLAWAPELDQWDPTLALDPRGRLLDARLPHDCGAGPGRNYRQLRQSLWDPHATAFRAMVLADGYQQFRGLLPSDAKQAWLRVIRETGDALALPSGYERGGNHGITQSAALLELAHDFAGADAELLPRQVTDAWLDLGRHRFNDLLVDTVFPDGVQVEQSPFYHNYALGLLMLALEWTERVGLDLASGIDPRYGEAAERIPAAERRDFDSRAPAPARPDVNGLNPSSELDARDVLDNMVRAAVHLALPDGWIPLIGSSLPQWFRGYNEPAFSSYLEEGGRLAPQLRYYRSGGTGGEPPPDRDRLAVFEDSGFVTFHSAFAPSFPSQTHVVFQAGLPYHRHSHADALAIHVFGPHAGEGSSAGAPLLVDPGWFSYRARERHYFESTRAHNTVHVDGANQCVRDPAGKRQSPYVEAPLMSCAELAAGARARGVPPWGGPPGDVSRGSSLREQVAGQPWLYQSAQHGLYPGVAHRRAVLLLGREVLVVLDDLQSDEPRTFTQSWHLAPEVPRLAEPEQAASAEYHLFFPRSAADSAPSFSLHEASAAPGARVELSHGEAGVQGVPGAGWFSSAEEQRQPSQVVEFVLADRTRASFGSVFLLGRLAAKQAAVALSPGTFGDVALEWVIDGAPMRLAVRGLAAGAPWESVTLEAPAGIPWAE